MALFPQFSTYPSALIAARFRSNLDRVTKRVEAAI
jgi:hypothetical protein